MPGCELSADPGDVPALVVHSELPNADGRQASFQIFHPNLRADRVQHRIGLEVPSSSGWWSVGGPRPDCGGAFSETTHSRPVLGGDYWPGRHP